MTEEQMQERMSAERLKRSTDPHYCSCAGGPGGFVCPYKPSVIGTSGATIPTEPAAQETNNDRDDQRKDS